MKIIDLKALILAVLVLCFVASPTFAKRKPKFQPLPPRTTIQPRTSNQPKIQQVPFKTVSSKVDKPKVDFEAAFSDKMKNSTLVGKFSVEGSDKQPQVERYEIKTATKMRGNIWLFTTRIKYGKVDTTLPIPVTLLWAGDTPMVSLTNATIPGMGTFSARVLFYGNRYAGTWQHGKKGGHMWGLIESEGAKPAGNKKPEESNSSSSMVPNSSPIPTRLLNAKTTKVVAKPLPKNTIPVKVISIKTLSKKTISNKSKPDKSTAKKTTVINEESEGWVKRKTKATTASSTKILKPAAKSLKNVNSKNVSSKNENSKKVTRPKVVAPKKSESKNQSKDHSDEIPAPPEEK